ncbi:DUF2062 domain-containing protein [Xinfangfangia sp. CPCC 101601]|uniref:DUF2062 domain-containing protein n=1 Tax=Pseudogemmobacter lacusdianii TaxID=3069608 RepID=A0ABU0VXD8_9RHOB|nr:DUF2062 domain-containing protein [Xinfangfangia sp. CPCC 101601]
MVFKRRDPLAWGPWLREQVYPKSGIKRATRYVIHRMRRLPDQPHRVARGVFAGSLIGFLPLPGLQFVAAWLAARVVNGNLLAALLATFNTNPLTTPFFAVLAMTLGHWIMGIEAPLTAEYIGRAFADAGSDLWYNFMALFGPEKASWTGLIKFWHEIYVPYFIGALGPGILISAIGYYITIPLVSAYQKARAAKASERHERRSRLKEAVAKAAHRLTHKADGSDQLSDRTGDDDSHPAP